MLIEKIDCVFIWAGDKMIDCRQLGRWNCSAALRITEGLFSPPLLPHQCTTPFVFLSVAPSPFHSSFSVSREFSTVMDHFCPLQMPGGKIFKLMSEQRGSTCVYGNGQVLGVYYPLLCCFTFLVLKSSAVLSSFSLSQHCTSHLHVHPNAQMGGCVWTAEYIISLLYHHYCSCWVSASVIMMGWLVVS